MGAGERAMLVTLLFIGLMQAAQTPPQPTSFAAYAETIAHREEAVRMSAATPGPAVDVPATALRDPHSWVLSQCSPLVLPGTADPEACEARHWAALQALDPDIGGPRPAASLVAASAPEPETRAMFGGRCQASQRATADEGGSSASGEIICGNGSEADRQIVRDLLRPQR